MSLTHSNDIPAPVAKDVGPNDPHGVHAVPKRLLMAVYIALVVCTFLTVGASKVDMGDANIWVALLIAMVKGALVIMFFMHLWWDSPFNAMALITALFFVALFIGLALLDAHSYQYEIKPTPMATPAPQL
ncbi:MAG TPA: cytochrome C oxidase subunit IV family protein [Tepidisphaeraceae bacterium]|jgi:cytochrome c oxidase subunit 4|nr:cytochrome C oxidase subunit IV family protein [Tepidisphaeraceae bacterium]